MNEIGEILKDARIEQGYTLDDLQQITKIQKRYLQAIEEGNTDILPGRFYARAFVKQYADIVGLDGEQLLEENMEQTSKEASEEFAESVNVAPTRSTQSKSDHFLSDFSEYIPTILIFLLVAAIFIVIYVAWRQTDGSTDDENALINEENTEQVEPALTDEENENATEEEPAAEEENTAENTEDEENTDEEEEETEEEQTVEISESTGAATTYAVTGTPPEEQTVTLTANGGDSWVSISVDGGSEEAALLSDGQSMDVNFGTDTSEVNVVVGNAAVTDVALNDTTLDYAPESEGIVRQDLTLQFNE